MPAPALPLLTTSELVIQYWIGTIPGLSLDMVSTQLPADDRSWTGTGFITVAVVGGSPDIYLPVKQPVIQLDGWATKPGSNKPPFWQANVLLETVRYATLQRTGFNRVLEPAANGVAYPAAVVRTAYFLTEPRRVYADAADYARYSCDMQIEWTTVTDRID